MFPGNPTLDFQTLDLVVVETEKLHIPVPFRAVPSPRITWHKDGKEIKADDRLGFRSVWQFISSRKEILKIRHETRRHQLNCFFLYQSIFQIYRTFHL